MCTTVNFSMNIRYMTRCGVRSMGDAEDLCETAMQMSRRVEGLSSFLESGWVAFSSAFCCRLEVMSDSRLWEKRCSK